MWIDLSTDKKESNKSLSRKSDVITEPDNLLIKSKDPNSTYIIEKGASVNCSPDINNKNLNTMIGENFNSILVEKCIQMLDQKEKKKYPPHTIITTQKHYITLDP